MKPRGYYKQYRAFKSLIEFVNEAKKDYHLAVQTVNLCKSGVSWEHATWIYESYINLEIICQNTKYADTIDIDEIEYKVKECDENETWEECAELAVKYINKINYLFHEFD